ncbi:MAG: M15 family metallopeptidase [Oscillospiraceae bacterium]|nr:M15 family metallopeptidase [Oscillospiraceae bacterium]
MSKVNDFVICPQCGENVSSEYKYCTSCRCILRTDKKVAGYANGLDILTSVAIVVFLSVMVIMSCNFSMLNSDNIKIPQPEYSISDASSEPVAEIAAEQAPGTGAEEAQPVVPAEPVQESNRGYASAIPEDVRNFMLGKSMTPNDNISFDDLSYLTIPHWDFNDARVEGHMIVNAALAEDVLDIFAELYDIRYPIENMEIVDYFFDKQTEILDSPDRASMGNNNTSSFYYRVVAGSSTLSKHALGRAIDLNPKTNPYVNGSSVSPANAAKYSDRSQSGWTEMEKRAFIGTNTEVYRIFRNHGWEWGGEIWSYQDYQHFQKP